MFDFWRVWRIFLEFLIELFLFFRSSLVFVADGEVFSFFQARVFWVWVF